MQNKVFEYLKTDFDAGILITNNDKEANLVSNVAKFLEIPAFVLPDFRAQKGDDLRAFNEELYGISEVLSKYYKCTKPQKLIISPYRTLLNPLPNKDNLSSLVLHFGDEINISDFKNKLVNYGYELVDIVQEKGEARISGDIIDIFSVSSDEPVRILLDFDAIESIRKFDPATQKSNENELENVEITPFLTKLSDEDYKAINEKLENFDSDSLIKDFNSFGFWFVDSFEDYLEKFSCVVVNELDFSELLGENPKIEVLKKFPKIKEAQVYNDFEGSINKDLFSFHKDKKITVLSSTKSAYEALDLGEFDNVSLKLSDVILNIISKDELIISLNKPVKKKRIKKASLVIDELRAGDFVVHEDYGIGKFMGLELITVLGNKKEFVVINYLNDDRLLLPVDSLNLVDRFIAGSGGIPHLDKLGKAGFARIKEKVREKLFLIANKIIQTAATRELIEGVKLIADEDYDRFKLASGFIYTKDQVKAVNAIKEDLQSGKVMDRLLSGDVGFGKTEVAMNAIYLCVKSGYQAFFFVPTTLLSSQHFASLKERLTPFGIKVFRYDRFSTTKEKNALKKAIEDKEPLVVVGTHALLNLNASNLGLIIVDEEHKFGVKQKEKLKAKSANSHILSMSATPIPRSLNMALSKVKSYSTLTTPPLDRLDTRTFVKTHDSKLIKEVIMREIRRKGQVFYVHNLISDITQVASELKELIPNLNILILHSKIDAKTTEEEMLAFANGKYDMLLSTSIIESGIHLPNANTIIIDNANKFGMADLHQLRGRVGRSNKQGYCYFLIAEDANLSEQSSKRLTSLQSNSFLGSGAILAYHDLEIRGGGNLLGEAQSGHIEQIGYSLYLKMLEDEINFLLNAKTAEIKSVELKLNVNAFLNSTLINEDRLRLELYRRLSKAKSPAQVYDIGSEIEDRFGALDIYTKQFLDLIIIKILASKLEFKAISSYEQNIALTKQNDEKIILKAPSKDDDDIIATLLKYLRKFSNDKG